MRHGADARLPIARLDYREPTRALVYKEMLWQIARDYPGLPDVRALSVPEIVFFYEGLRSELKKHTRSNPGS